jgi:hypothetical protein
MSANNTKYNQIEVVVSNHIDDQTTKRTLSGVLFVVYSFLQNIIRAAISASAFIFFGK